jgi:hypothetical protein
MNLKTLVEELKKKLQGVGNFIPPVNAYSAVQTLRQPQARQDLWKRISPEPLVGLEPGSAGFKTPEQRKNLATGVENLMYSIPAVGGTAGRLAFNLRSAAVTAGLMTAGTAGLQSLKGEKPSLSSLAPVAAMSFLMGGIQPQGGTSQELAIVQAFKKGAINEQEAKALMGNLSKIKVEPKVAKAGMYDTNKPIDFVSKKVPYQDLGNTFDIVQGNNKLATVRMDMVPQNGKLELHDLFVNKDLQQQGIGTKVIERIFEKPGVTHLTFNVPKNEPPFWKKIGAEYIGQERMMLDKQNFKKYVAQQPLSVQPKGVSPQIIRTTPPLSPTIKGVTTQAQKGVSPIVKGVSGTKKVVEFPTASQPTSQPPKPQPSIKPNPLTLEAKPEGALADSSSLYFNTDRLNVKEKAKTFVTKTIEEVKPVIEKVSGKKLSNKEVVDFANNSARVLNSVITKQETLAWEAKLLKARQLLAQQAKEGKVTQEYLDNLMAVKTQGTDIARKLQSMAIGADPKNVTVKQAILEAVLKLTQDTEEVLSKARGVDFNNYEQAASFYRQFVKPKAGDWLEKIRYSSMLSSPNTHINNTSSNLQGTGLIAPIEKTISGGVDRFLSAINPKRQRTQFVGEGLAYAKGYYSKLGNAYKNFIDTMRGTKISSTQEMYNLPLTEVGTKGRKVENVLSFFPKLLQAEDEFFQTLTEGGVKSSLTFRQGKGVKVADIEGAAYLEGRKRLFNAAFGLKEEGYVLKALEYIPQKVAEARMHSNPVISTIAKYTFPFVRIPSNILKASVEYGPLGVATLPGASDKVGQLSKAILGSAIGASAALLVGEDRLTWAEPTDEKKRNAARAARWQPYSLKIGNTYLSYAKMHPAIAFPLALVAAVRDSQKKKLLDDGKVETVLDGVAKWVNFYATMSYVKNIGDMVSGVQGDLSAGTRQASNYVQQLVPFRALMGWVTRIVDKTQRQVDSNGNILTKQLQSLMTQIPGLSGQVPARVDSKGNPIENPHRFINAISPIKVSTENPQLMKIYNLLEAKAQSTRQENAIKQQVLDTGQEQIYNGKKFYLSKELDTATGEYKPVVKSIKVAQTVSGVYSGLPKEYGTSSDSPKNLLQKIAVYGTGIFKDPSGTINAIKTGQPIRKVSGDAVVVERLIGLDKLDQGDQSTQVDHVIAVSLGGTNDESNLAIISTQDNQAKGIVDTYLSNELKAGRITKKVAQERDLNWRNEINNLPATEKAKALAILKSAPVKQEVKVSTGILDTLSAREYEPIFNSETQTYSDIQIKIPEYPKLSGMAELDKQLKSKYTSALSTAKTNIGKLYVDGQITAQEANDAILALKGKSGSAKKPTKITFKVVKYKPATINLKRRALPKLSIVKLAKPKITKSTTRRYTIRA